VKVEAVQCDAKGCPNIEVPEGADLPYGWLLVDIYQEGDGNVVNGAVFCSWVCLSANSQARTPAAPLKRKRRTRAQIEADALAATHGSVPDLEIPSA
jgi:hypothetical protein